MQKRINKKYAKNIKEENNKGIKCEQGTTAE